MRRRRISARRDERRRGPNQAGVRLYNERLMLSLVRRFGQLVQDRSGAHDGTFGAVHLDDHEPAAERTGC